MRSLPLVALALMACALGACGSNTDATRLNSGQGPTGTLLGGPALGRFEPVSAVTETAVSSGALIGPGLASLLDASDQAAAQKAELEALEHGRSGEPRAWSNAASGRHGEVVPEAPYQRDGRDCRNFTHSVVLGGRTQTVHASACRQANGTWASLT